jgi:hypothetical protein
MDYLTPFLHLPSVEIAWANAVDDVSENKMDYSFEFPNVKELSFTHGYVVCAAILRYVNYCFPNLTKLRYAHVGNPLDNNSEPADVISMIDHLYPHLQHLTIFDVYWEGIAFEHHSAWSSAINLTCFQNLRRLNIGWPILIGRRIQDSDGQGIDGIVRYRLFDIVDTIPTSLEWLRLRGPTNADICPLQTLLLLDQKHRFPALKQLDFGWKRHRYLDKPWDREPFEHPAFTKEQSLEVLKKCKELGVEMIMKTVLPQP